jgi:hypothetical protein
MVGLVQGFPLATQPVTNPQSGMLTEPWLHFFEGIWRNASSTTLPSGVTLPPGSVDLAAFAPFLNPVGLAPNGLPNPVGYTGPKVVFSSDGNLYRYVNGAWTLAVPSAAIVGQIPLGNIPPIPTTQLTGYVQAAQIQANSIGADQISAGYIYAGSIAASQITAGTLGAGVILASNISATQINAGTLNSGVILASSINASQINAGTLTAFTIQTASSGARIALAPSVFLTGYNSSGNITINMSPNILGDNGSMYLKDASGNLIAGLGASGGGSVQGFATGASANAWGGEFKGLNSSSDAVHCTTGGVTISNGYLAMGGGNITGLGSNLTSTATTLFIAAGSNVSITGNLLPNSDNAYHWGNGSFRAIDIWAVNGTIQTSDGTLKDERPGEELRGEFLRKLRPIAGRWKDDPEGPTHQWLIAQEIERALEGKSFAGLIPPEEKGGIYSVNYAEFIPILIAGWLEHDAEIRQMKKAV